MLKVINLVSWAGVTFSYAPGDEILIPKETAHARVKAGLAAYIEPPSEPQEPEPKAPARRKR